MKNIQRPMKVLRVAALLLMAGLGGWLSCTDSAAYEAGQRVSASPFDQRLAEAGVVSDYPISAPFQDDRFSIENLFRIARSFRYAEDGRKDNWQSANETDAKRSGDCEDIAVWLYARLGRSGFTPHIVIGRYRPTDVKLHVWIVCEDAGGDYLLDPVLQGKVWRVSEFTGEFYRPIFSFKQNETLYYGDLSRPQLIPQAAA